MTVHMPLIILVTIIACLGYRICRPPFWLVVMLMLVGFLSAHSYFAPAIHSGTKAGVEIVDSTAGWGDDHQAGPDREDGR
ncbi:hypothetical protein NGB36_15095 [Streptomyces sp. RB6PN25]|uniref:Uncharacterized protein n=1 Tax=Streptomyces humicola TaxID=2953240 RepID=A0ABT1PW63_9ACTN|nr:hypothetical protein [Streptomyces humicola]MCQ4081900.1 hypothetical protein [Streptomyces humicola]